VIRDMVGVTVGRDQAGFPIGFICRVNLFCCRQSCQRSVGDNTQADEPMQAKPGPDFIFEISPGFCPTFLVLFEIGCRGSVGFSAFDVFACSVCSEGLAMLSVLFRTEGSGGRRELIRVGALGGCSLAARGLPAVTCQRGQQRSVVFIFLFGGPSQLDMWDMKPAASVEIRGQFQPISTSAPGVQICEHLPQLAGQMHRVCLVRSMNHRMPVHGPACSELYSGRPYPLPPVTDQARREDWPSLASLMTRAGLPSARLPPAIVLPWHSQFGSDGRADGAAVQSVFAACWTGWWSV